MSKPTIDEILEPIASGWRGWTYDQLEGTSFIKDELDEIELTKADAKQQLTQLIADIIGEPIQENALNGDIEQAFLAGGKKMQELQRQRAKERGIDLEEHLDD